MTQNAFFDANAEIAGNLLVDGAITYSTLAANSFTINPGPLLVTGNSSVFGGLVMLTQNTTPATLPSFGIIGQAATDSVFGVQVLNDSQARFQIAAGGSVSWGSGAGPTDTDLFRSGAGTLRTDGALVVGGTLITTGLGTSFASLLVNPGPLTVQGSVSSFASLASFTNTMTAPADSVVGFFGGTASDRLLGIKVSGDANARFRALTDGTLQWGPGTAATDTTFNRSGAATLSTSTNLSVGGSLFVAGAKIAGLDTNVNDIQIDGVPAAGAVGLSADAGHVHLLVSHASFFLAPAAADYETIPRQHVTNNTGTLATSGGMYAHSIALPTLQPVNFLAYQVGNVAARGITHGYYFITDQNLIVRATSADQGSSTLWGTTSTTVTLQLSPGYTVPSAGLYYIGLALTGSTLPSLAGINNLTDGLDAVPPALYGLSQTSTTPPAVGSTITALNVNNGFNYYGYTQH